MSTTSEPTRPTAEAMAKANLDAFDDAFAEGYEIGQRAFGTFSRPLPSGSRGDAPPRWPRRDPRTTSCTHDWTEAWGSTGERQRLCLHCDRWVWEHDLPVEARSSFYESHNDPAVLSRPPKEP